MRRGSPADLGPCQHQFLVRVNLTGGRCGFAPSWAVSLLGTSLSWSLISPWPCATPEAASQRGPPVSSFTLIMMAGHLERDLLFAWPVHASANRNHLKGGGHSCASGPCNTDLSQRQQRLCLAWLLQLSGVVSSCHRGSTREISQASN